MFLLFFLFCPQGPASQHRRDVWGSIDGIHLLIHINNLRLFPPFFKSIDLILLGGEYRPITGAFVGSLTNKSLGNLSFSKAFVSANGIHNNNISTYSENEGLVQQIALEKAMKKYLLLDNSKFNKFDFYDFYTLDNIDYLLTDTQTTPKQMEPFITLTSILSSENLK